MCTKAPRLGFCQAAAMNKHVSDWGTTPLADHSGQCSDITKSSRAKDSSKKGVTTYNRTLCGRGRQASIAGVQLAPEGCGVGAPLLCMKSNDTGPAHGL